MNTENMFCLWSQEDYSKLSTFRSRFWNDYPETKKMDALDILFHVMELCRIKWVKDGDCLSADELSDKLKREELKWKKKVRGLLIRNNDYTSAEWDYLFITDKTLPRDKVALLDVLLHELAHLCLKHTPDFLSFDTPSQLSILSSISIQLGDSSHLDRENQTDLFKAVFLFSPFDQFLTDLWKNPLEVRFLAKKYMTSIFLATKMLMLNHHKSPHFLLFDIGKNEIIVRHIPGDYNDDMRDLLSNDSWLFSNSTALQKSIKSNDDECSITNTNDISFHCKAFHDKTPPNKIYVVGMDAERLQMMIDSQKNVAPAVQR